MQVNIRNRPNIRPKSHSHGLTAALTIMPMEVVEDSSHNSDMQVPLRSTKIKFCNCSQLTKLNFTTACLLSITVHSWSPYLAYHHILHSKASHYLPQVK